MVLATSTTTPNTCSNIPEHLFASMRGGANNNTRACMPVLFGRSLLARKRGNVKHERRCRGPMWSDRERCHWPLPPGEGARVAPSTPPPDAAASPREILVRTACLTAGCPGFAVHKGRCERHRQTTTQRGYGARWQAMSRGLRHGAACEMCGSQGRLAVDHVTPRSLGGSDARTNLRTLCANCHARHGAQSNRARR